MEQMCPLCNGLTTVRQICPLCGHALTDGGSLQDFFGPYSPYVAKNSYGDLAAADKHGVCIHLLYCPSCGYDRREEIGRETV